MIKRCFIIEPKNRLSIDKIVEHEFFSPKVIEKPLICPFSKGTVKVYQNSILFELNGHEDVMRIYNGSKRVDVFKRDNEFHCMHYTKKTLPEKYQKRLVIALNIAQEAEKKRPLVIWNTNVGKYIMFGDMSLHLLFNKTLYPVHDQPSIQKAMVQMISCVRESSDPQWPIVVGTSK